MSQREIVLPLYNLYDRGLITTDEFVASLSRENITVTSALSVVLRGCKPTFARICMSLGMHDFDANLCQERGQIVLPAPGQTAPANNPTVSPTWPAEGQPQCRNKRLILPVRKDAAFSLAMKADSILPAAAPYSPSNPYPYRPLWASMHEEFMIALPSLQSSTPRAPRHFTSQMTFSSRKAPARPVVPEPRRTERWKSSLVVKEGDTLDEPACMHARKPQGRVHVQRSSNACIAPYGSLIDVQGPSRERVYPRHRTRYQMLADHNRPICWTDLNTSSAPDHKH